MFAWLRSLGSRPAEKRPDTAAAGKSFETKIAGVSHRNKDGRQRQSVLKACRPGDIVEMRPEPDNPHDHLAVGVYVRGHQAGYLASHVAASFASQTRRNTASAVVHSVNGGTADLPTLGLIITITLRPK
jgi:hypothetical protein